MQFTVWGLHWQVHLFWLVLSQQLPVQQYSLFLVALHTPGLFLLQAKALPLLQPRLPHSSSSSNPSSQLEEPAPRVAQAQLFKPWLKP
jgi:hypothetical protein